MVMGAPETGSGKPALNLSVHGFAVGREAGVMVPGKEVFIGRHVVSYTSP